MRWCLLVLALGAALVGAPPRVSAAGSARIGPDSGASVGVARATENETDAVSLALVLGLAGLALVAVSGSGFFLVTRRRRSAPDGRGTDERAATLVERRAAQRAHLRLDDDPIVAAMGLPERRRDRRDPATARPRERS